jgi:hypothetical protein
MRYLLFPDEEIILCRYLTSELGLKLLASNLAPGNIPKIVEGGVPANLNGFPDPAEPKTLPNEPMHFLFWCSEIGGIETLGSAETPSDPKDRVSVILTQQASEQWRDVIDFTRTPVIFWARPCWYKKDHSCVVAGRMNGMTIPVKKYPVELKRLYGKIDRMLRKTGVRLNPFDYVPNTPVPEPENLNAFWVFTWPQGMSWLENGGELWPWDA